jgi:Abortive infection C-terminus
MPELKSAPLSDAVLLAVAKLVDDAQTTREPSHSQIGFQIDQAELSDGDPNRISPSPVGKLKRVRATLSWAIENNRGGGESFVLGIINLVRSCGGFRPTSPNYVGSDPIQNAISVFRSEGYELSVDGELRPLVLDALSGIELTEALEAYVRRAKRGATDAALLAGTSKDLLEATAAHIVIERFGDPGKANFPTLLDWAFNSLGMARLADPSIPDERATRRMDRAMFSLALSINQLRNKEGTGHGRPWLSTVTDAEAKTATELMGCIAERMLSVHRGKPR